MARSYTGEIILIVVWSIVIISGVFGLTWKSRTEKKSRDLNNDKKLLDMHVEYLITPIYNELNASRTRADHLQRELERVEREYVLYEKKIKRLESRIVMLENDRDSLIEWASKLDDNTYKTIPTLETVRMQND